MHRPTIRVLAAGLATVLVLTLSGVAEAESAGSAGPTASSPAAPGTEAAANYSWGVEFRPSGLRPCSPATPARCFGFAYDWTCPTPGSFRLTRIRTYMGAIGERFVGFRLRARLIEHGQPATGVPWSVADVETFPGRPLAKLRLMDTRNISGASDVTVDWDIQVQYRFDRTGLPDIVAAPRHLESFNC
jgi:hypothetical protein